MPKDWKPLSIGLAAVAVAATAGVLIWVLGFRGEDENTAKAPTAASAFGSSLTQTDSFEETNGNLSAPARSSVPLSQVANLGAYSLGGSLTQTGAFEAPGASLNAAANSSLPLTQVANLGAYSLGGTLTQTSAFPAPGGRLNAAANSSLPLTQVANLGAYSLSSLTQTGAFQAPGGSLNAAANSSVPLSQIANVSADAAGSSANTAAASLLWVPAFCTAFSQSACPPPRLSGSNLTFPLANIKWAVLWYAGVTVGTKAKLVFFDPNTKKEVSETSTATLPYKSGAQGWCCGKKPSSGFRLGVGAAFNGKLDRRAYVVTFK
jgi:hypothetical protein